LPVLIWHVLANGSSRPYAVGDERQQFSCQLMRDSMI